MRKQKNVFLNRNFLKIPLLMLAFTLFSGMCMYAYAAENDEAISSPQQQKITVSGKVVDNLGDPIPGATIVERGTKNGTSAGSDGRYTLTVAANAVLEISSIGFVKQSVAVTGSTMDFTLREDTQVLDEVVVTGFGLAQRKATLTGAVSMVGAEEIKRSNSATSSGALVGKIAGINSRQTDGRPGGTTSIEIRNYGRPLYVIDGVESDEGQFNNINFNDIETITLLKDASAAIYGMRAANGVVVVSTKKGSRNTKNTVTLTGYYGWQTPSNFSKPADAVTYIESYIQSETVQNPQRTSYTYSKEALAKWKVGTEKGYVPFDWYDYVIETAPQSYLNANVSGGSDRINYYVSIGRLNQDMMFINYGGFYRTNFQMNIDADITKRLRVGISSNGRIEYRVNPGVPQADDTWMPRFGIYRNLPTRRPFANDNPKYPTKTSNEDSTNFGWLTYEYSGKMENTWRVMQIMGNFEYDLFDGLQLKGMGSYYFAQQHHDNQEYTYKLYDYDPVTDTYPVISHNTNPWRERTTEYVEEIKSKIQLAYKKTFGDHDVNYVSSFDTEVRNNPRVWVHARPLANAMNFMNYSIIDNYDDNLLRTQARMGWLNILRYAYASKYLIEALARYDGSWKFPPGDRWGLFPAASVGWRISEETFWKNGKLGEIFNDFKLRGSYGLKGQDQFDNYNAYDFLAGYSYPSGSGTVLDGNYVNPARDRGLPVITLSWLRVKEWNVGIDFAVLKNRLSGQADYFRRIQQGLPARRYDVLIPSETGFSIPYENLNSDMRMGWEGMLRWRDNVGEFNYSIGANLTYSRRYNWEQYKPRFGNSWDQYRNSSWHRYANVYWGYEVTGMFKTWDEIANYPVDIDGQGNKTIRPGDFKYKDANGDNQINGMDYRPIGYNLDATPILNFGLNFAATWKGFDLAFDLTGGAFNSWLQDSEQRNPFHGGGNNAAYYMKDAWRLSDIWDANSELIPGKYPMLLIGNNSHSNYWINSFWLINIRYIKLRNGELGYTIPARIAQKAGMSSARIYVGTTNLFTLSNGRSVDPEARDSNGLGYPTMRVINIGLNLKF